MKKWSSLKNLKTKINSEENAKKNLKRQSSSPYLNGTSHHGNGKSSSLNKNLNKKASRGILTQTNNFGSVLNYHSSASASKSNNLGIGTKSSHNRDTNHKESLPRSLSSKKIRNQNKTIMEPSSIMNAQNSSAKKIKRASKGSWK